MAKIDLDDVASGYNRQRINQNFQDIETELNNKVLYRDNPSGEPNQMENNLDMNSNDLLNVSTINTDQLVLDGVVVVPMGLAENPPASDVSYDDTTSNFTGATVQSALDSAGTSVAKDVGTDPGEIPLNSDGSGITLLNASELASGTVPDARISATLPTTKAYREGNAATYNGMQQGATDDGSIIESGSNANGNYIKYADGALICFGTDGTSSGGFTAKVFPVSFIDANYAFEATVNSASSTALSAKFTAKTAASIQTAVVNTSGAYQGSSVDYVAIGRWK